MVILIVVFIPLAPCGRVIYQYIFRQNLDQINFSTLLDNVVTYFPHDALIKNIGIVIDLGIDIVIVLTARLALGNSMVHYSKCLESVEWYHW